MIYEVRTYTLRTGTVPEFEERYEKRLPARLKHSKLGAFWHTDFGPLNQVEPPSNWWTPLLSSEGSGKVSNGPGTSTIYG
jgi:NIPSNAP